MLMGKKKKCECESEENFTRVLALALSAERTEVATAIFTESV